MISKMAICPDCGVEVIARVFPGGSVRCVCGATIRVPRLPRPRPAPIAATKPDPHPENPCPRCHAPLESTEAEGYFVDTCPTDHGVFVTHDVLASMRTEGPAVVDDLDSASRTRETETRYIGCPRRLEPMPRRIFEGRSGIVVDVCAAHGTWFDAGELRDALAFAIRHERIAPPKPTDVVAQEKAKLDVALAFEAERDAREVEELTEDLANTFSAVMLGGRTHFRVRRR
jgi:Zn-finger nucleic acid-binding protein